MTKALFEIRQISKNYPGVRALQDVSISIRAGEIHALMGENGAGKSTLIKVMTGAETPDTGELFLESHRVSFPTPTDAQSAGISTVYQEVNLISSLTVAENIVLGRESVNRFGLIDWKKSHERAEAALAKLNLRIDVSRKLETYPIAIQQMVAIARALDLSVKVLILDEPTSSLDTDEVRNLFAVMRTLRERGIGIVFVTHFLDQVYEVSDRITVLRNGELVGEYRATELPRIDLVSKMMGKELVSTLRSPSSDESLKSKSPAYLRARGFGKTGKLAGIDLEISPGEVVGLAGLLGSGRTEFARLLFGIDRADIGSIEVEGKPLHLRNPRAAIRSSLALLPEDRKNQAILPDLSIAENISVALQAKRGWLRRLSVKAVKALAEKYIRTLGIACADSTQPIRTLSGGNQQKVILARWLASDPDLLILDEPTRGIDVGAKSEIQKLVRKIADDGKAVLFISSDLEETVACCDRVAVLRDRKKIGELSGLKVDTPSIMHAIADGEIRP